MNAEQPVLPSFERPPVNEVALGVQFEPLERLQSTHVGLLWTRFRDRFPRVEEQPPLAAIPREDLSGTLRPIELRVEMINVPPVPRVLLISESGNDLLQVQNDRFHANWRRVEDTDEYPRYPHVRANFEEGLGAFMQFVAEEGLGDVRVRQVEVTYVNQLLQGEGWERLGEISRILAFWRGDLIGEGLPEPEVATAAMQFIISGDHPDDRRGRLYVDFRPSLRTSDLHPLIALNLTARLLTEGDDVRHILEAIDLGRAWIVRAFAGLTTSEMHDVWGRRDGNP